MSSTPQYNWSELSKELNLETVIPQDSGKGINLTVHGNNYQKIVGWSRGWKNSELADCLRKYGDRFFSYVDARARSDETILVFRADMGSSYIEANIYGKNARKSYFDQVGRLEKNINPFKVLNDRVITNFFLPQIREANRSSISGIICLL